MKYRKNLKKPIRIFAYLYGIMPGYYYGYNVISDNKEFVEFFSNAWNH